VVIVSAVEDLVVAASVASGAAGSEADGNYLGLEFTCNFSYNQKLNQPSQTKHMKKLLILTNVIIAIVALALITASEATAASASEISRKEALLAQSGFKVITVTTPQQKEAVKGLAQGRCSAVMYNGKLFYVFPTATKDKFYVGKQAQFNTYKNAIKNAIAAKRASKPAM
jgi:hypothetical protein